MKKMFRNMAYALLGGLMLSACSAEEFSGANGELPNVADFADNFKIDVDQETNTANFTFDSKAGITPVWVIDGAYSSAFNLSKYYRKKGTYDVECFVKNRNGISKESVRKLFSIEKTKMNGFGGFVEDSEFNMFKGLALPNNPGNNDDPSHNPAFWYAPGWNMIAAPNCSLQKGCYTVKLPQATTDRWQAQMALLNLGISTSADKHYDFSCIITSAKGHNAVKVKLCDSGAGGDDIILFDSKDVNTGLEAGEPKCIFGSDLEGKDIQNLKVVFDFGGNQADDEIMIESLVLKDLVPARKQRLFFGLILPFFSKNSLVRRSRSSSVNRSELAAMAPIMTMLAPFGFSCSAAISVMGTLTTLMSSRYSRSCTSANTATTSRSSRSP